MLDIVVAQSPAHLDGPQARFDWLEHSLTDDRVKGAHLLLLPELFLTGYNIGANAHSWAETADGPYAQKIAALCKKHDIAIHYGFAEREAGKTYNAANCFSRAGTRIGGHRKLLLPPGFEGDHFAQGHTCTPFTLNDFKIGTLICYDAEFPETARCLAQQGVDLILVPTALSAEWGVVANTVIPTRAFENGVFVCYANQSGHEHGMDYLGHSCIIAPDGTDIKRAGSIPEFLRATLNKAAVNQAQTRLPYLHDLQNLPLLLPPPAIRSKQTKT